MLAFTRPLPASSIVLIYARQECGTKLLVGERLPRRLKANLLIVSIKLTAVIYQIAFNSYLPFKKYIHHKQVVYHLQGETDSSMAGVCKW